MEAIGHYVCNGCGMEFPVEGESRVCSRDGLTDFETGEPTDCPECGSNDTDLIEAETC